MTIPPLAALAGLALFAAPANAQIITPISGTVNVQLDGAYGIENTIDGSGLSGGGTSGDILSETHSRDTTGSGNAWLEGVATPVVMTFDLGGTFTVDSVHLWNYVHANGSQWGVATVDISFSTDGGSNYGNLIDDLGVFTQPGDPIAAQTIGFSAQSGVTHIKLDGITSHGPLTGISEIRFGGSGSPPIDPVLSQDLVNGDPDLDFGTVVDSAPYSESRTVRFVNDGPTSAIEITTASVTGDTAYSLGDIAVNGGGSVSLPQSLAVGDYIEFTVAASLAAPASGVTGSLVIDTDADGQDQNLPISGSFTEPIDPVLSQDTVNGDPDLDFGTVVGSAPYSESRTVRFVNDGPTSAIEITTASVTGDTAYSLGDIAVNGGGSVSLPQSLAVGDYIEFTVAASLAAPASGVTGNLVIDTDADDQDENLPITGSFTDPPPIITPISGTVNVQLDGAYGIENTIDGSGLSGGGTSGDILSETHSRDTTGSGNAWLEGVATPVVMTFDLGGTFTVDSVHLWNYVHENNSQWGVATVDISFSTDGGSNYGNLIDDLGVFTQPGDPIAAQTIGFSAQSGVTHIKLDGITSHGGLTGISEIRFGGSPSTGGNDYDTWADLYDPPGIGGPEADDDGDRLTNDYERLFGLDPTDASSVNPISVPLDTAAGTLSYTRRNTGLSGASYSYEYSTSLVGWTPFTPANESSDSGDPVETVTITLPASLLPPNETKLFVRVVATEP